MAVSDPSMAEDDAKFDYNVEVDVTDFAKPVQYATPDSVKPLDLSTELNSMIQADSPRHY